MASSTSMPPPSTSFTHRRTNRLISNPPLSPPLSPESQSCLLYKMSLSKGATFHVSSSPSTSTDPVLSIRHLPRRSPTCSSSSLTSWLSDKQDVVQSLADFEHTFSGARGKREATRRRSAQDFEKQLDHIRATLSSDEGLGSSISSSSEKGLATNFERALDLVSDKDSALGSSISGGTLKNNLARQRLTSEEDGLASRDLIQGWLARCLTMCDDFIDQSSSETNSNSTPRTARQPGTRASIKSSNLLKRSAVTQSVVAAPHHPPLSSFARKKLAQHIYGPLLRESRFEDLYPLVTSLASKSNKAIRCLRDLEQSLIFQPLVSTIFSNRSEPSNRCRKTLAISRQLYRSFGEFSIQLVLDTYQHLSETDQRRAADRSYDTGYFLDLVQQVGRLATQIDDSHLSRSSGSEDEMMYSADDEVTLEGGLGETGQVAELVRWKNGKGISLRTGMPYEALPGFKREASNALDEDAERSMARRKKGYIPEIIEMECSDPGCGKIFTRKCDLAKHEKTHSRPFKCPIATCKYHEMGLPTEKERDRHINDKHDANPQFYKCDFCEFRTKRESNCKQHQEKKHGWHYERAKGKDKVVGKVTPAQTPQTPSMDYASSSKSPAISHHTSWDEVSSISGSAVGSVQLTPFEQPISAFDFNAPLTNYSAPLFPRHIAQPVPTFNQATDLYGFGSTYDMYNQGYISPAQTTPISPAIMGTPLTPAYSNITGQSPYNNHNIDLMMGCGDVTTWNTGLPTPGSFLQAHSRHPSMSHESPIQAGPSDITFMNDPMIGQNFDVPETDFSLFGGENSHAFSNPAAASATLFPGPDKYAAFDSLPTMDDMSWVDDDIMMN